MDKLSSLINLPFQWHLFVGAFIRGILIAYGDFHDKYYDLPYTDVDYKVFTDAARHVLNGFSPYRRHTYRYSPVLAYLMIPNVIIYKNFGKILFSIFDILVTIAVKVLVQHQISSNSNDASKISIYCSLFWLYNPLSIGISTRGNADSVPCFFIIMSLLFLQTNTVNDTMKYILSGLLLGISIHLRLYPLVFSFPMYLSLGIYKINRNTSFIRGIIYLMPNKRQIILTLSCVFSLCILTVGMYFLYGYEFLFETYLYHLFRKDTRHNFSVLFYYSYLTMNQLVFDVVKSCSQILECIILFVLSLTFGSNQSTLNFALFCQAVIMVAFNSVMTSQYFIWFLSLLPLVIHNFKMVPAKVFLLVVIWVSAQGAWLFYAYLLEFKCREVFIMIWLKSIVFFCSNIYILAQLIKSYKPFYNFGQNTEIKDK